MAIGVICPGCGERLIVAEHFAGRRVTCSGCHSIVAVPVARPAYGAAAGPVVLDRDIRQAGAMIRHSEPGWARLVAWGILAVTLAQVVSVIMSFIAYFVGRYDAGASIGLHIVPLVIQIGGIVLITWRESTEGPRSAVRLAVRATAIVGAIVAVVGLPLATSALKGKEDTDLLVFFAIPVGLLMDRLPIYAWMSRLAARIPSRPLMLQWRALMALCVIAAVAVAIASAILAAKGQDLGRELGMWCQGGGGGMPGDEPVLLWLLALMLGIAIILNILLTGWSIAAGIAQHYLHRAQI